VETSSLCAIFIAMTQRNSTDGGTLLRPAQAAVLVGVHPNTLANWAKEGRLAVRRLPSGHRRYAEDDIRRLVAQGGEA
jgi:hypothetical protein